MEKLVRERLVLMLVFLFVAINLSSQPFTEQTGISLTGVSDGSVEWGDYDNDGFLDILQIGSGIAKVYKNIGGSNFSEQTDITSVLTGVYKGAAAWGDYDNDGFLDILITGSTDDTYDGGITKIYKNNGNNTFTEITGNTIDGVMNSAVAWGDYDNDGDLDFVIMGQTGYSTRITKIFKNNGANRFDEQTSIQLRGLYWGDVEWGDYDNDGWLDLVQTGSTSSAFALFYHNNGDDSFTTKYSFPYDGYYFGSSVWNDYNNDGWLDLFICGKKSNNTANFYLNNTDDSFSKQTSLTIPGLGYSSAAWGDCNNDGYADLFLSGTTNSDESGRVSKLYKNNGNNTFTEIATGITGLIYTSAAWGDYDNDGDLDLLLSGSDGTTDYTKIYRNDATTVNVMPDAPVIVSSEVSGSDVTLSWKSVVNDLTPSKAMTYNLMVGTSSGSGNILAPNSSTATGFRRIPAMGNGQLDTTYLLNNLKIGTYYWRVQAIDNAFMGGTFSSENTFTISTFAQAFNVAPSKTGSFDTYIQWVRGTGTQCAVFMKEADTGTASPVDGTTYSGNTIFGNGSQIGSTGWYCMYIGTSNSITVTNLKPNTNYSIHVCEMTGPNTYLSSSANKNPEIFTTDLFTEQTQFNFVGSNQGNVMWGDYNKDGLLDFISGGSAGTRIFKNDGSGDFIEQTSIALSGTSSGMAAWGDYNNDNYLDLITIGAGYTKLYKNNGNNTFSDQTPVGMNEMGNGSVAWADFDNDGDLDIVLSGASGSLKIAKIYRNNGDGTFTNQPGISLPGNQAGEVIVADYNNDGFIDICIGGELTTGNDTQIFLNNGDFIFTFQSQIDLEGIYTGGAAWGDYNQDGNIDLFLSGLYAESSLYMNNGDNSFSLITTPTISKIYSSASLAWGDMDNDGDLDLFLAGYVMAISGLETNVYRNDGSGVFTKMSSIHIENCGSGSFSLADYDMDGDLDVLVQGQNNEGQFFLKIYSNDILIPNIAPVAPDGLTESVEREGVRFNWNPVTTDSTTAEAITYNLRVGKTSTNGEIISAHSLTDGTRLISAYGNMQNNTSFLLEKLKPGNYYWTVQAIDNSFTGGAFATERSFTVSELQAQNLSAKIIDDKSLFLKWQRGNGERCVVFCKQGIASDAVPVNNTTYLADNRLGYGSQIGSSAWYCVYNGRADSVMLNGLAPNNSYSVHVIEYIGEAGAEQYYTSTSTSNPGIFETTMVSEQISMNFDKNVFGSAAFADYDNDDYLDLLITGTLGAGVTTQLYQNNGNNTFTEQTLITIAGTIHSDVAWADYDNDGFLDFLIAGATSYSTPYAPIAKLYHNDAGTGFTETSVAITGVSFSSVSWGDYNNDEYIDFAISGARGDGTSGYDPVTEIYKNNGNGTFSPLSISLPGMYNGDVAWGDFDNDGDLDLLVIGHGETVIKLYDIYENKGDDNFSFSTSLPNYVNSNPLSADWGDYNNDGYLDLIVAGGGYIKLYKNNGDKTFATPLTLVSSGCYSPIIKWAEFNNDGLLDFVWSASIAGGYAAKIFLNKGNNSFTEYPDINLTGSSPSALSCGDYDNDGDNDFFLAGFSAGGYFTSIYRNNIIMNAGDPVPNEKPIAPTGMENQEVPGGVILKWNPVKTNEVNFQNLSYNVKVTNTDDNSIAKSAHSLVSGKRTIVEMGNSQLDTFLIQKLPEGNYKWAVQAVDQAFAGGVWSSEQSFTVKNTQAFFKSDTVCQGLITQFTDQSVATDGIASWNWDFSDGNISTLQNPVHIFSAAGSFQVKLVVTSNLTGAKDSITQNVIVKPKPIAAFNADVVCLATSTVFNNNTSSNGTNITSWNWTFGDGGVSDMQNPPDYKYDNSGDYIVELIAFADNGCSDTVQNLATVAKYPVSIISTVGNPTFCEGNSVKLSVPENSSYNYQWKVGGVPLAGADSSVYFAIGTGDYVVSVTNQIGECNSTSVTPASVLVSDNPNSPLIQTTTPTTFCDGDSVVLSVANNLEYSYQWKRDGGAVSTDTCILVVKETGIYTLEVANSTGCKSLSTNSITVTVNPVPPVPTVDVSGVTDFCDGSFVNLSVTDPGSLTYQWKNEDITISGATSNIYTADTTGNYRLIITNSYGCVSETLPKTVNVYTTPTPPVITSLGPETFCAGGSLELSATDNPDLTYIWLNGTEPTGSNQNTYTASSSGNYTLRVKNSSNCTAMSPDTIIVTVNPVPIVQSIERSDVVDFCAGRTVDLSVTYDSEMSYQWMDGDITLSGEVSNIYTADTTGNYKLVITNSNGCFSETQPVAVNVYPTPPLPSIVSIGAETFCSGGSVELSVTEYPDLTYQWLIGGEPIGSDQNTYTANTSGSYTVRTTNSSGCSKLSATPVVVTVNPVPTVPTLDVSDVTDFCDGSFVNLSVTNDASLNYQWKNEDITISGATTNEYTATTAGNYKLVLSNSYGCVSETLPKTVNVYTTPTPPVITSLGPETFCTGGSVELSITDNPDYTYQWLIGGEPIGSDQNTYTAISSGSYSLRVTNSSICSATSTSPIVVTVNPVPAVPTIDLSGPTTFCEDEVLTMSVSDPGADSYQWMNDLGTISGETASSININKSGIYRLRVRNASLCEVFSKEFEVVVNPFPLEPNILTANYGLDECQSEDPVMLSVETVETGIDYQWYRNGNIITNATASSYQAFLSEGEYSVEADNKGCKSESNSLTIRYGDMPDKPEILAEGPVIWYLACSNDTATTYRWYREGNLIANASDYLYVAGSEMGKYEVSISEGGCFIKSDPVWIPLGTGIEEDLFQNLKIYPNPTPGKFTIEMDNPIMGDLIIDIFGEQGKRIINIKFLKEIAHFSTQIDLSDQPDGVYLIELMLEEHRASRRLVVE